MTTYVMPLSACSCGDTFRTRELLDAHLKARPVHKGGTDPTADGGWAAGLKPQDACLWCGDVILGHWPFYGELGIEFGGCDHPHRASCQCDTSDKAVAAAVVHHKRYGDMFRAPGGRYVCGLERCALHYPETRS